MVASEQIDPQLPHPCRSTTVEQTLSTSEAIERVWYANELDEFILNRVASQAGDGCEPQRSVQLATPDMEKQSCRLGNWHECVSAAP